MANRRVIRGDSDSFYVTFSRNTTNSRGRKVKTPIDITGWTIRFTVRSEVPSTSTSKDTNATISKLATITDKIGVAYFDITSEDTNIDEGNYWFDIEYTDELGKRKSIPKGKYMIVGDITREDNIRG